MSREEVTQIVRESERRRRSLRPPLKLLLPTVAALGAGAAIGVAAIPGGGGVITGCYLTAPTSTGQDVHRFGELRLIDTSLTGTIPGSGIPDPAGHCFADEKTITWNQQGPQGPPGVPGPAGLDGGAGPKGADGSVLVGDTSFGLSSSGDRFLKLDGIKGESTDKTHKDQIEITSFSIGATNTGGQSSGGGGGQGKVSFNSFTITKKVDKSSPTLFAAVTSGKHIASAEVSFSKKSGGKPLDYLVFKMSPILVTSLKLGGQNPTEQVTFSFAKMSETFQGVDAKGKKISPVTVNVNVNNAKVN
jgi:type VI secretion system secreted protein Hcp